MSVDYSLEFCYGMIVSEEVMNEIQEVLYEFDIFQDYYARQIDCWCGGDWFVGVTVQNLGGEENLVHEISSDFLITSVAETIIGASWKAFSDFYDDYNLNDYFDWKPKLYLINFCY